MSTIRRNTSNPAARLLKSAQEAASTAGKSLKRAASTTRKGLEKAAMNAGKNVERAATAATQATRAAAKATKTGLQQVREETRRATEDAKWTSFNSKFEAKEGKLEMGTVRGFGSKMDEAPTLKELKTTGTGRRTAEWVAEPEAKTRGEKAKAAGKEVLNSVGISVFDPEKAKFERDWDATGIKTRRVDAEKVKNQGYDVGYRVLSAYADGKGNVTIGKATNVEGKIEAGAVLVQGTVEGKAKLGKTGLDATGKAEATVGATAAASGGVRVDVFSKKPTVKVKAGVEAFAGAKASVEGRVGNDYAGVGARAEAWAGVGAKAKADVGIEGGRFKAKVELGAALGVGGSLSFSVDVNYQKAVDKVVGTGKQAVETIRNAGSAVVDGAGNLARSGWRTVSGWFGG